MTTMKKFSRNVVVAAILGAAGVVAITAVPASAAPKSDPTVQTDTSTSLTTKTEARKVWEW
jgi:hypothetical protein